MTLKELGEELKDMYDNAPIKESVSMIHLFGIKFAEEINQKGYSKKDIIESSGIPISYLTELNKGMRLAKFVVVKDSY